MSPPLIFAAPVENEQNKSTGDDPDRDRDKQIVGTATAAARRSVIITPRSESRRVTPASISESVVEKRLSNGDLYIGSFSGHTPHGSGKYLWRDGCMYEGDWKKGKACGKGRFSWPSGATFEGEFRSGRMEGSGTFIGSDGDTYKGSWSGDKKHGYGIKHYINGDFFEGHWKRNHQDGQGRYLWSNGNEYIGEWKNGTIHGRGVLIWSNRNRYAGNWECGVPKGNGVFTWPDGSCYMGCWSKDSFNKSIKAQILNGTFYTAQRDFKNDVYFSGKLSPPLMVVGDESANVVVVSGRKRLSFDLDVERAFPRICIWESDGEAGDITCDIIDKVEASMLYRDRFALYSGNPCCVLSAGDCEMKKPGQMVLKGHKNYDLMLNLQLGIRYSVGKHALISHELVVSDFDPREKFWTRFPTEGSKITPRHQSVEFRWKDYCPLVFRHLRDLFQVDPSDYMLAICGNGALRELSSPGKSGSLFYLTQDDRFMIKTVKKSEVKVLIKMLPSYYQHMCCYENSLVTKFFGVHCVKPVGGVKTRFIVMGNLFCSEYRVHRRFDLKGSSHGRTTDKSKAGSDETTTLKDLDLNYAFRLQTNWYQELIKQIHCDCEFLENERIMDYSLLVGLHFRDDTTGDKFGLSPFMLRSEKSDSYKNEKFMRGCRFLEAGLQDMGPVLAGRNSLVRLGANMPARAQRVNQSAAGGFSQLTTIYNGETYEVFLYFGIIDILQDYDISKKLEHAYKSWHVDPNSISAVDPKLYSKRFQDFVGRIFVEDK